MQEQRITPSHDDLFLLRFCLRVQRSDTRQGGGCPAVPTNPGHVRRLHPYPSNRRRRR